jgi:hypothetical protein
MRKSMARSNAHRCAIPGDCDTLPPKEERKWPQRNFSERSYREHRMRMFLSMGCAVFWKTSDSESEFEAAIISFSDRALRRF